MERPIKKSDSLVVVPISDRHRATLMETDLFKARRMEIPTGGSIPWHFHTNCIDLILPLSGSALLKTEESETVLSAHNFYIVQKNRKHAIKNTGDGPFLYLLFQSGSYDFNLCEDASLA